MDNTMEFPSLVPPLDTNSKYFAMSHTDIFRSYYTSVLWSHQIETSNSASSIALQELAWKIYAAAKEACQPPFSSGTRTWGVEVPMLRWCIIFQDNSLIWGCRPCPEKNSTLRPRARWSVAPLDALTGCQPDYIILAPNSMSKQHKK